jgi:LmbE family N-acetylglucosaminyl deacetylase
VRDPQSAYLEFESLGTPEDAITTVLDTGDRLDVREAAIALHASQISPFEAMPADLRRAFLAVDRLRRVRPEWTGGPIEHEIFVTTERALSAVDDTERRSRR